jgi:hypothetical protein
MSTKFSDFRTLTSGRPVGDGDVRTILNLLASTDLTMTMIAERMGCSPNAVRTVNTKHRVRVYDGHRTVWTVGMIPCELESK